MVQRIEYLGSQADLYKKFSYRLRVLFDRNKLADRLSKCILKKSFKYLIGFEFIKSHKLGHHAVNWLNFRFTFMPLNTNLTGTVILSWICNRFQYTALFMRPITMLFPYTNGISKIKEINLWFDWHGINRWVCICISSTTYTEKIVIHEKNLI